MTKVDDIERMMALGIMATPAIAFDGKVVRRAGCRRPRISASSWASADADFSAG